MVTQRITAHEGADSILMIIRDDDRLYIKQMTRDSASNDRTFGYPKDALSRLYSCNNKHLLRKERMIFFFFFFLMNDKRFSLSMCQPFGTTEQQFYMTLPLKPLTRNQA